MPRILIVEDDAQLRELISSYLEQNFFTVTALPDGQNLDVYMKSETFDLVILDINLPGEDGFSLCRRLRKDYSGPIMFLTARLDEIDQIVGFEIGADDYVTKPVEPRLLLARVKAVLRRVSSDTPQKNVAQNHLLQWDGLAINLNSRQVTLHDEDITLTTLEFDILVFLAKNKGQTISRERLYQEVIGREYDGLDRSADVRISRLRAKLKDNPKDPKRIKTIWGKGFYFVEDMWTQRFDA